MEKKPDWNKLCKQAHAGDMQALEYLRNYSHEGFNLYCRQFGDVVKKTLDTLLELMSKNPIANEGIRLRMKELEDNLAGPSANALERLLAERIALNWLELNWIDVVGVRTLQKGTHHPRGALQKHRDHAHRRFLAATKALAQIRRLNLPAMINYGNQQVNIGKTVEEAEKEVDRP